jgi:hypothetical protein
MDKPVENRYNSNSRGGNWATYIEYGIQTVNLYSGQTNFVGTATLGDVFVKDGIDCIKITIELEGAKFNDRKENVKIQDYKIAPSGNPASGLFDHKFTREGTSAEVKVPLNNFYGIHLDVDVEVECPEEDDE